MYKVKITQFEGPLNLLLELIEQEELDITNVSLAAVTESYLKHIEANDEIPPEELTDFLVVATRLLLIKSKLLLPFLRLHDDDDGEQDLEAQLKIFKYYLDASRHIEGLIAKRRFLFVHDKLPKIDIGFSPPEQLSTDTMAELFRGVIQKLEPVVTVQTEKIVEKNVSIHDKIRHIRTALLSASKLSFRKLITDAESKTEIIVSFLALLELVKQRHISVIQEGQFNDITINKLEVTTN